MKTTTRREIQLDYPCQIEIDTFSERSPMKRLAESSLQDQVTLLQNLAEQTGEPPLADDDGRIFRLGEAIVASLTNYMASPFPLRNYEEDRTVLSSAVNVLHQFQIELSSLVWDQMGDHQPRFFLVGESAFAVLD